MAFSFEANGYVRLGTEDHHRMELLRQPTRSRDRGEKFAYYRTIPSLRHYVLVEPDRREVDHYARQSEDAWLLTTLHGNAVLNLDPPGVELTLDEIYRRVNL